MKAVTATIAVLGCLATAHAQQPDMSQVQIKTNKIAGNFYTLDGQGGTIGVLSGPDGVLMVDAYFANANAIMTGDFYRSTGYPNIDRANGGTMNGMLAGFDLIAKTGRADTKIIPGHGPIVDKAAVAAHKAMMMAVRDKVAALAR